MYHNLFDSHTHSENSPDGNHSVSYMAEAAVARGIQGLAITDHAECDLLAEQQFPMRVRQSALDTAMTREAFRGRLYLAAGIELGQPLYDLEGAGRMLGLVEYDVVLASLHRMQGWEDFYEMRYSTFDKAKFDRMLDDYFRELLWMVEQWGRFDVVAHLTMPLRYPKLYDGIDLDIRPYGEQVDAVLRAMARQGKALEVNTSGLRNAMEDTMPPAWIVKRFKELGGEYVTIGSDAHRAEDVGAGIADGMALLEEAGFRYVAFFRGRKPLMMRII